MDMKKNVWNLRRFGLTPSILGAKFKGRTPKNPIFVTSQPKSGTHLLERILCLMPGVYRPLIRTLNEHNVDGYGGWEHLLSRAKGGQLLVSHAHYSENLAHILNYNHARSFLMVRDPRAMILSFAHYVKKREDHADHSLIRDVELETAIDILIGKGTGAPGAKFLENINLFIRWSETPGIMTVKFEDVVGGDRTEIVRMIAGHAGVELSEMEIERVRKNAFSSSSPTFRSGQIDEWKGVFSNKQIAAIEKATGQAINSFGYT